MLTIWKMEMLLTLTLQFSERLEDVSHKDCGRMLLGLDDDLVDTGSYFIASVRFRFAENVLLQHINVFVFGSSLRSFCSFCPHRL